MAGTIHYKLGLNSGDLMRGLMGAGSAVTGFLSKAARLGSLAGSLIGVGSASLAMKNAIEGAAEMESLEVAFTTLTKNAKLAQKTLGELGRFADETPLDLPEIASAAKKLLAMKGSASTVKDELRMLGDIGSLAGVPLGEMAEMYGKMRVNGRLMGDDMNQLMGRGVVVAEELAKQFGVDESAIRGLVEEGKIGFPQIEAAFRAMTSEGGNYFGGMKAQSQTAIGLWSTFKGGINSAMREFGKPVLGPLKQFLNDAISQTGSLVEKAKEYGQAFADGLSVAYKLFQSGNLGAAAGAALKLAFAEAVGFLLEQAPKVGSWIADGLVAAADMFIAVLKEGIAVIGAELGAMLDKYNPVKWLDKQVYGDTPDLKMRELSSEERQQQLGLKPMQLKLFEALDVDKAREAFNALIKVPLEEVKAANEAAKAAFEALPEPPPPVETPKAPAQPELKSESPKSFADSLAKIGLAIGGGGPAGQRFAQDTAKATKDAAKTLVAIERKMSKGGVFTT